MNDPGKEMNRSPGVPALEQEYEVVAGGAETPEQRAAAEWSAEAARARLTAVRTSAQHWQATLSTIVGLFGAATVLNADGAVRALTPMWSGLYGVLVMLSLGCAALAIKLASLAGEPERVKIPADINKQVKLHRQAFTKAWGRLSIARLLALPAVILLITAMAVRWYGPRTATVNGGGASAQTSETGSQ